MVEMRCHFRFFDLGIRFTTRWVVSFSSQEADRSESSPSSSSSRRSSGMFRFGISGSKLFGFELVKLFQRGNSPISSLSCKISSGTEVSVVDLVAARDASVPVSVPDEGQDVKYVMVAPS